MVIEIIAPILVFLAVQNPFSDVNSGVVPVASKQISLETRQAPRYVNDVFRDNILLNLAYLDGRVAKKEDIKWEEVRKPFSYQFVLSPQETFAFHEDVLSKYQNSIELTTNAHFNFLEGFKSDGYLMGDGVCHLASLIYWVAKEAGLDAYAPTNHNFADIPEIPREFGVAIYSIPGNPTANALQNMYITNSKAEPVIFEFAYNGKTLKFSIGAN